MITKKTYDSIFETTTDFYNRNKFQFIKSGVDKEDFDHDVVVNLLEADKSHIKLTKEYLSLLCANILDESKRYNQIFVKR